MAKTLQQILGYVGLTGTIQAVKSGIPDPLPPALLSTTRNVIGDSGRYTRLTGERRTARLAQYGAAAVHRELRNVASVDVKLLHFFESQPIPPLVMQQLRNYDNYEVQKMGMAEVSRQVKEFVQLFKNGRIAATLQVLANGVIYYDGSGNLLPNSSGAVETVSFQMNANNQNQLNGVIATKWNLASTDIPNQLRNLKLTASQLTGYDLKYAMYGRNVPSYLTNNDYCLDYLARNPRMNASFLDSADLPAGLFGFDWIPGYISYFQDQNSTSQSIVGNDQVIFFPEPSADWWEMLEGSYMVPTNLNITTDAAAAISSMKQVFGMFGYGITSQNPPGVQTFYGDTYLPVLKNPDCLFQSTVVF